MSRRTGRLLVLVAIAAACFGMRALGFQTIFAPDGTVALLLGDGAYHARLASWSFANFPGFLTFDPYLAGPEGGPVPWPPLFDWLVAAIARVYSSRVESVETVLAWIGPACGPLAVAAVYAAARAVAAPPVALGAAALFAFFGTSNAYGAVGNGDHHAFVATLGAAWLALALHFMRDDVPPRRTLALGVALGLVRGALLAGWAGSLLYLGIADAAVGLVCALAGDRRRLAVFGFGAWLSGAITAALVVQWDAIAGGAWSSITLSWLHVAVAFATGTAALVLAGVEAIRPPASQRVRTLRVASLGAVLLLGSLGALATFGEGGLAGGLRFLGRADAAGADTTEQVALLPYFGERVLRTPETTLGWLVYLLPIAPLLAFARLPGAPRRSAARSVLAGWCAAFALLALAQLRYANDVAAPAAVCFALGGARLAAALRIGGASGAFAATLAGVALLWPASGERITKALPRSARALAGEGPAGDPLLDTISGTLVRFAQAVRAATPETPGYLDAGTPAYGIVANPILGHTLRHYARRPLAADGFWDKFPMFDRVGELGELADEAKAFELLRTLRLRFVVTTGDRTDRETVLGRLSAGDGVVPAGAAPLRHFRLLDEGPRGGHPLADVTRQTRSPDAVAYKLFEVVPGAQLEIATAPGAPVRIRLALATTLGRQIVYVDQTVADAAGLARFAVPYATRGTGRVRALGAWHVEAGARAWQVDVDEAAVTSGAAVRVGP